MVNSYQLASATLLCLVRNSSRASPLLRRLPFIIAVLTTPAHSGPSNLPAG